MSYGNNFEFRVSPRSEDRSGRYVTPTAGARFPIGVPIQADISEAQDALGLQPIEAGDKDSDTLGMRGVLVYEFIQFQGVDEVLTNWSDLDSAPLGAAVQMVHGSYVKFCLRNTEDRTFLATREYTARKMVAGTLGSTVVTGKLLKPMESAAANDTNGYWEVTATEADAWLVVESVDVTRGEVEARMLF